MSASQAQFTSTSQEDEDNSNIKKYVAVAAVGILLLVGLIWYFVSKNNQTETQSPVSVTQGDKTSTTEETAPINDLKTFVTTTNIPTAYANAKAYVPDPAVANPIIYASLNGCTVAKLPSTDGWNTNGLYFAEPLSYLHMTGFPSGCFDNDWTIEFFLYAPTSGLTLSSNGTSSVLITSPQTIIPVSSYPDGKTENYLAVGGGYPQSALKMNGTISTTTTGGLSGGNVQYKTGGWTSVVIQYFKENSVQYYSIWVTPRGGTSANMIYSNGGNTPNLGPGSFKSLVLGGIGTAGITCANGAYLTNLRISNVARYNNSVAGSMNQPVVWPEDDTFVPDQYTTYFNSFDVVDKQGKGGWNYSQVVAGNAYFS